MAIKIWRNKGEKLRDRFVDDVKDFCANKKRKNYFVIVADPETNAIVGGHAGMISAAWNKDNTHTIKEMFVFNPQMSLEKVEGQEELQIVMKDEPIDSLRNRAIKQFLFEIDGLIDAFGKKIYNLGEGEKEMQRLMKQKKLMFGAIDETRKNMEMKGFKKVNLEERVREAREQMGKK
jgi:hypothetical protein